MKRRTLSSSKGGPLGGACPHLYSYPPDLHTPSPPALIYTTPPPLSPRAPPHVGGQAHCMPTIDGLCYSPRPTPLILANCYSSKTLPVWMALHCCPQPIVSHSASGGGCPHGEGGGPPTQYRQSKIMIILWVVIVVWYTV